MEVFFLDVAQGTCQVVLLGSRRAIIIDCGLVDDLLLVNFLHRSGVQEIDCLVISHSHDDHLGGGLSILGAYQDRIKKICFVQDDKFLNTPFWARLSELLKSFRIRSEQLTRLESTEEPQLVWQDNLHHARLRTYSPSCAENLIAQSRGQQNATSAILILDAHSSRIVFGADSEVEQWREIHRKNGRTDCDLLAVPHHAGKMHNDKEDLEWFLDHGVSMSAGIVSVGTANQHGHPREDVIKNMTARGIKVLCTQVTKRCVSNLEAMRPGVLNPVVHLGRASAKRDLTSSGHSRNVACAGTICALISDQGIHIDRLDEHQLAVDKLASLSGCSPLCR